MPPKTAAVGKVMLANYTFFLTSFGGAEKELLLSIATIVVIDSGMENSPKGNIYALILPLHCAADAKRFLTKGKTRKSLHVYCTLYVLQSLLDCTSLLFHQL